MQAMILKQPANIDSGPLVLSDCPVPEPSAKQVLLNVKVCGVCHTDLHTVEGELDLPRLPLIPGHQIIGIVKKNGSDASRCKPGERVGVAWLNWACGECEFCRKDKENLCPDAKFTGLHVDGGYAQYTVVDERFVYPIPDVFSDIDASPLLCAGVIGYRSLRLSEIKPGENLGLYGFGASAHIAIQVARYWGCKIYVFTRGENHRRLAEKLGAVWTGSADDIPPEKLNNSITFTPAGWIIPQALNHLQPGGTLAINAIYMSPIPEMEYAKIYEERTVRSVAHVTRKDAEEFLPLAAKIGIKTEVQAYNLKEANEALKMLKNSEIRGAAALKIC
jgi:alcohol dehydrogenase, propanol-preferring